MRQQREFTVAEFSRRCESRTQGRIYPVPFASIEPFLDRCVQNGLLVKRMDENTALYSATYRLLYLLPGDDE